MFKWNSEDSIDEDIDGIRDCIKFVISRLHAITRSRPLQITHDSTGIGARQSKGLIDARERVVASSPALRT